MEFKISVNFRHAKSLIVLHFCICRPTVSQSVCVCACRGHYGYSTQPV